MVRESSWETENQAWRQLSQEECPQWHGRTAPGGHWWPLADSEPTACTTCITLYALDTSPNVPAAAASRTWMGLPLQSPECIPRGACFVSLAGSQDLQWLSDCGCTRAAREAGKVSLLWKVTVVTTWRISCAWEGCKKGLSCQKNGECLPQFSRTWSTCYGAFGPSEVSICCIQVRQFRVTPIPQYTYYPIFIHADTSLWDAVSFFCLSKPCWSRLHSIKNYA